MYFAGQVCDKDYVHEPAWVDLALYLDSYEAVSETAADFFATIILDTLIVTEMAVNLFKDAALSERIFTKSVNEACFFKFSIQLYARLKLFNDLQQALGSPHRLLDQTSKFDVILRFKVIC